MMDDPTDALDISDGGSRCSLENM